MQNQQKSLGHYRNRLSPWLEVVVFTCGAAGMIFELAGSRVLGPHLGTSTYVWTSLIGVILGSMSLGYWLGGRLADRGAQVGRLALIVFCASISVLATDILRTAIFSWIDPQAFRPEVSSLIFSLILFSLPSVFLGMVSPYAIKLKMHDIASSGSTAGNLYALSTLGSIVGTFLAGFYLIPSFGTAKILAILAGVLLVVAFGVGLAAGWSVIRRMTVPSLLVVCILPMSSLQRTPDVVAEYDSEYTRIWVREGDDPRTGQTVRYLQTDPYGLQSAMYLESEMLVFDYTRFYNLSEHFNPIVRRALMIGGCAYSYPKEFLRRFPDASIDVVEIDPKMTEIAKEYFRLPSDPRLTTIHADGRVFLNQTTNVYDVIYNDAFNSYSSVPYQLTTQEAIKHEYDHLSADGVVIANIISAMTGPGSAFLRAEYRTFKEVFPHVYLFPVQAGVASEEVQNVMLVALKNNNTPSFANQDPELQGYLDQRWIGELSLDKPIFTDDYAPVEYYKNHAL